MWWAPMLLLGQMVTRPPARDSAWRQADTIVVSPLNVRFTVPARWMGRPAPQATGEPPSCQRGAMASLSERLILEPARLAQVGDGRHGLRAQSDAILRRTFRHASLIAQVGATPFATACFAPQVRLYVADSSALDAAAVARTVQPLLARHYLGVHRAVRDSAAWQIAQVAWQDPNTDYYHPNRLEVRATVVHGRRLFVVILDGWAGASDVAAFLASMR